jgi:DNA-binding beta-propeller fold protein YncE
VDAFRRRSDTCDGVCLQDRVVVGRMMLWGEGRLPIYPDEVAGCKTLDKGTGKSISSSRQFEYQAIEGGGWLSVFLNLQEFQDQEVALEIAAIEVKTENSWIPLINSSLTINTKHQGSGQILLARNMVGAETFDSMRLHLRQATVRHDDQATVLAIADPMFEMEFPDGLNFKKGDSHSLFVNWNVKESIQEKEATLVPAMKISMQAIPLLSELLFLACPDIGTVYVLRTDINWVISSLGITGRPIYVEADDNLDKLYILASDENVIKIVDLKTFRLVDEIVLVLDFEPSYMFFDHDRNYAYVLDEKGRSIALVNMLTGVQETRVNVSYLPRYGIYVEERNLIAVSGSDTNKVYLLNPETLTGTSSISVASNPEGLLACNDFFFIAESGSNTVAAYDLMNRSMRSKVNVGFSPRRLLLKDQQIYITNLLSNSVARMFPGQFNVSGEIAVKGRPLEMEASESRRWLYVSDLQMGGLHVIDSTSNRLSYFIDLATLPSGMSVID